MTARGYHAVDGCASWRIDLAMADDDVVVYYGTCGLFAMQRMKVLWADGARQVTLLNW